MFGDIQAIGNLIDRVLDIKNAFLIQVKYDLAIFGVIGHVAIGIHLFDGELQRLRHQNRQPRRQS